MEFLRKIYYFLFDTVQTFVIAGAIFVVIYAFLFRPYQVNGRSMDPTFEDGEYVLTNLIDIRLGKLNRGDVIVFHAPVDQDKDYIKRVIGMPGDHVKVMGGKVFVNEKEINQSFLPDDLFTNPGSFLGEGEDITVPEDNFFVMGDNRNFSSDSREWGFVSKDKIIGKSFVVYFPINHFRVVEHASL